MLKVVNVNKMSPVVGTSGTVMCDGKVFTKRGFTSTNIKRYQKINYKVFEHFTLIEVGLEVLTSPSPVLILHLI